MFFASSNDQSPTERLASVLSLTLSFPNGSGGLASVIWKNLRRASSAAWLTAVPTVSPYPGQIEVLYDAYELVIYMRQFLHKKEK